MAGKSGTARRTVGGRYGQGGVQTYTSSFVGLFPARNPQYVVLVKLDNPRGTYYGGKTAAPVSKAVITAALAARDASLDWGNLAARRASYVPPTPDAVATTVEDSTERQVADGAVVADAAADAATIPRVPLVDTTPEPELRPPTRFDISRPPREQARVTRVISVPDVRGLPLRVAVRELHRAGFKVQLTASGGGITSPPARAPARPRAHLRVGRPRPPQKPATAKCVRSPQVGSAPTSSASCPGT